MDNEKELSPRQVAYLQTVFPDRWQELLPMARDAFSSDGDGSLLYSESSGEVKGGRLSQR